MAVMSVIPPQFGENPYFEAGSRIFYPDGASTRSVLSTRAPVMDLKGFTS